MINLETIIIIIKFIIYSVLGYYLFGHFKSKDNYFYGFISPFYGFFAYIGIKNSNPNIINLYIFGIIIGLILNLFLKTIDKRLGENIHIPILGLLNICNYYILDPLIDKIIFASSLESIIFFFIFSTCIFLIDISISVRNNT